MSTKILVHAIVAVEERFNRRAIPKAESHQPSSPASRRTAQAQVSSTSWTM